MLAGTIAAVLFITAVDDLRVPEDFPTIQEALDAAADGDRVLVGPGVYTETVDFLGKDVHVLGAGPEQATIDAGLAGSTVSIVSGEGPGAILEGFTLRQGDPACVQVSGASPQIRGNVIRDADNLSSVGVLVEGTSSPLIEHNVVRDNMQIGILCRDGNALIRNNEVFGSAEQGILLVAGSPAVTENDIHNNGDNGIRCLATALISLNHIHDNGDAGVLLAGPANVRVVRNRIENNISVTSGGIDMINAGTAFVYANEVRNNTGFFLTGGIGMTGMSSPIIECNLVVENIGGGISWVSPPSGEAPLVRHNTIAFNTVRPGINSAGTDTGAVVIGNNVVAQANGGVFCGNSSTLR